MIKFLLGVCIVAFTSFCGYFFARKYAKRKLFLGEMKEFNERFISEIGYYKRPLGEFISKYVYKGEFQFFLQGYYHSLEKQTQTDFTDCEFLTTEDRLFITDYFLMLGKGDSLTQKNYFTGIKDALAKRYGEAVSEYKKYGDLYIKIGFLCGLLILILMI